MKMIPTLILCAIAIAGTARCCLAQCKYTATIIPETPCPWPWGQKSNTIKGFATGDMTVGSREKCPPDDYYNIPITWTPETGVQEIAVPPEVLGAIILAGNKNGVLVGEFHTADHIGWPFVWSEGNFVEIPPMAPGNQGSAYCVNGSGLVGGSLEMPDDSPGGVASLAFVWQDGNIEFIPQLCPGSGTVRAISDDGFAVGVFGGTYSGCGFRWHDGMTELLAPLPGHVKATVKAVAAGGWAYGASGFTPDPGNPFSLMFVPCLWQPGSSAALALPLPSGFTGGAFEEVNAQGVLLLRTHTPSNKYFIYIDNQYYYPGDLLVGFDATSVSMHSISDDGHLGGTGKIPGTPVSVTLVLMPIGPALGDLNGDCTVDGSDLTRLLGAWGAGQSNADLDQDGVVSGSDIAIVLENWSRTN